MNNRRKIFLYILINIIVSALTVLCVLYFWERAHSPENVSSVPNALESASIDQPPSESDQNQGNNITAVNENAMISIEGIFGIGQSDIEHVSIRNTGEVTVNLYLCKLLNESGDEYLFPEITLNKDGAVNIFTKTGNNTVLELYWGKTESQWNFGDSATLLDQKGNILSIYQIP